MTPDSERSEQVIESYKRRKLAASAIRRIHEIIQGFEQDRIADWRMARIGAMIILALLAIAAFLFFGSRGVTV
ncbi:MAG: hypothetical protein JSU67_13505 [Gammaproteobacteria bacterium]|nr:MAG: hypothetical protein EP300_15130 [Gammaproteobacteria bacterium]UCH39169.1 MAG: hypothetical protein JSU67_13505 [Gammaproteobacteria bacterium]